MMRLARRTSLLIVLCLLTSAATAYAECAWVLWSAGSGFESGNTPSPLAGLTTKAECGGASKPGGERVGRRYARCEELSRSRHGRCDGRWPWRAHLPVHVSPRHREPARGGGGRTVMATRGEGRWVDDVHYYDYRPDTLRRDPTRIDSGRVGLGLSRVGAYSP